MTTYPLGIDLAELLVEVVGRVGQGRGSREVEAAQQKAGEE